MIVRGGHETVFESSFGLYVRPWRRKAVPSEILVKEIYISDCKISLAFNFLFLYFQL